MTAMPPDSAVNRTCAKSRAGRLPSAFGGCASMSGISAAAVAALPEVR
jgi:hypothetical protein